MKNLMLVSFLLIQQVSFFDLELNDWNNNAIDLEICRGKKVLIINIASASPNQDQINGLDSLVARYPGKLIVFVVPTNTFGNEPLADQALEQLIQPNGTDIILLPKQSLVPADSPLYHWFSLSSENGRADLIVQEDFTKIILDEQGMLIGMFGRDVGLNDDAVAESIEMTVE